MLSLVVCGLPICLPLALAFAIPDRTRSRIIAWFLSVFSEEYPTPEGICISVLLSCPLFSWLLILPSAAAPLFESLLSNSIEYQKEREKGEFLLSELINVRKSGIIFVLN